MITYVEKKYRDNPITQNILKQYPNASVLLISNYKNIFDKPLAKGVEKSMIIAGVKNAISEAPKGYGHEGYGFFFKNSLNCIYDCSYCYLRGSFRNNTTVFFVNYEEIQKQIAEKITQVRKKDPDTPIWFYSSDYSDNLATDSLTQFTQNFIPFFEGFDNVKMEIRTKSINIARLLEYQNIRNTEIAFSLNPSEIIQTYEHFTPALDARITAIEKLIEQGYQVGIRFMPLIETKDYKNIYKQFLLYVSEKIDFSKIYSVFIGGLLYTKRDYTTLLKKDPQLDILYTLEDSRDGYYREKQEVREYFYTLFDKYITETECNRCLEE
ncbi:hypothetical protein MK079_00560 [Candidatus Gracilibacteria bacterium]|nr:hypothetical protein [Candidatus Gracilibacteria bacterium]